LKGAGAANAAFLAALATLPLAGVGVVHALTGRELGTGLQPSWILLGLAGAAAVAARRRPAAPRAWWILALAAGGALALSAGGLVVSPGAVARDEALLRYGKQCLQLGIMAGFTAGPALWVRGAGRWRTVARVVVVAALLQAAYGALQFVHWYLPLPFYPGLDAFFTSNPAILAGSEQLHIGDGFRDLPRLRGTLCEPLYLGNFLLLALPLVSLTGWRARWRLAASVVLATLVVLTWSRGAWLAGLGALTLAAALHPWRGRPRRSLLLAGAALAAGALGLTALALGPEQLGLPLERLAQSFSRRDWSNLTRLYSMQAAWRAFLGSPWLGVGWGQFPWHFPVLVDPAGLQSQFAWPVVNNFYLKILAETGLVGFGVFAAMAGGLVRGTLRGRHRITVRVAAVACAGVWLQLMVFSQYNLPHVWVAPGLLLAALADEPATAAAQGEEGP
jgi:O-antigen ligase